ncbi:hypothetical protein B0H10DRAFT_2217420 [Mycena sp. CBHHK59/15]|nr:hypothetical protein B0H10DRAFT_2217420 [Mycena sp. CBHHK59/15]
MSPSSNARASINSSDSIAISAVSIVPSSVVSGAFSSAIGKPVDITDVISNFNLLTSSITAATTDLSTLLSNTGTFSTFQAILALITQLASLVNTSHSSGEVSDLSQLGQAFTRLQDSVVTTFSQAANNLGSPSQSQGLTNSWASANTALTSLQYKWARIGFGG